MRILTCGLLAAALLASQPATAHEGDAHVHEDEGVTREEIEQKKRELREMERELRKQRRAEEPRRARAAPRAAHHEPPVRLWLGVGAGVGWGAVDVSCQPDDFGSDCHEEGVLNTYTANATLAGRHGAIRLRGLRQTDKGDDRRTPYETAALIGTRFGRSNWYGLVGYGRIRHADDDFQESSAGGFAWEILFAPPSESATGFELSFQGNNGEDVDFVTFNLGMRVGALR